jgi:UDP-3-O-[3-hydroxymyristoyl] N-acetylglucosamine deacetylase
MAAGGATRIAIPASLAAVSRSDHATTLSAETPAGRASVQTVEHLVAALAGLGIDACTVEIDGPEVPILDGSSAPWVALLRTAGTKPLARTRRAMRVVSDFTVQAGAASISVHPAESLRITCSIDFDHPSIGHQEIDLDVEPGSFEAELAGARTFGFLHEVEQLRAAGLAQGASYDNAVVLDEHGVVNDVRWPDEFVRHKALDLVGDLALLGLPLVGHVVARRAGHRLHVDFARQLMARADCWRVDELRADESLVPAFALPHSLAFPALPAFPATSRAE